MAIMENELSPEELAIVERAAELVGNFEPEPVRESERLAMRAFLQRGETRLSTYQRVAGVFLNGAGLLVLLPGLAREAIQANLWFAIVAPWPPRVALLALFLFATTIPLYAFVVLLRDLVQFYFSPRFLADDPITITRFSLAGLTLPYDEGREPKAQVLAMKAIEESYADFILGGSSHKTLEQAHQKSVGRTAFPLRLELMNILKGSKRTVEMSNADKIGVAFSLAGSLDMSLAGEVARTETSICRHVLQLRKLVLRYSKALLIFVWTTIMFIVIAALVSPILAPTSAASAITITQLTMICLIVYFVWSVLSLLLLRWPNKWVDKLLTTEALKRTTGSFSDPDLKTFETRVTWAYMLCAAVIPVLGAFVWVNK